MRNTSLSLLSAEGKELKIFCKSGAFMFFMLISSFINQSWVFRMLLNLLFAVRI